MVQMLVHLMVYFPDLYHSMHFCDTIGNCWEEYDKVKYSSVHKMNLKMKIKFNMKNKFDPKINF